MAAGEAGSRQPLSASMLAKSRDMTRSGTGKYRTHGIGGEPDTAFVKDRSISFDIGERLYRERGYLPWFDELPWSTEATGTDVVQDSASREL